MDAPTKQPWESYRGRQLDKILADADRIAYDSGLRSDRLTALLIRTLITLWR